MTRVECEIQIYKKIKEIKDIYHEYNPDGDFLTMYFSEGFISANNRYWGDDEEHQIDFHVGGAEYLISRREREYEKHYILRDEA